MAMTKPIALLVNAFDATKIHTFEFSSSGGNQVVKNKIIIRNNTTNAIVYQNTVESYKYSQDVPANTLTNGVYYNYSFITYDISGTASAESNIVSFYCYTTPTLTFTNIPTGNKIDSSNFRFNLTYEQAESELLDTLEFILYDVGGNLISISENLYNSNIPPLTFSYLFSGFEDGKSYKILAKAITINGTIVTSGDVTFSVDYFYPSLYSILNLNCVCSSGYVEIENNMIVIDGIANPSPPTYIANKEIDLTSVGSYVKWIDGFTVSDNFTMQLHVRKLGIGKIIELVSKNSTELKLSKIDVAVDENNYLTLRAFSGSDNCYYFIHTDNAMTSDQLTNSNINIFIRQIDNIFLLKWEVIV